ncbi:MAG: LacI family DNA-binding transcriptional regulator [Chthoniobacterales bacterium]
MDKEEASWGRGSERPGGIVRQGAQPTMEDIAMDCGVSAMTVSRVLSGRPGVSVRVREKVLKAASQLNYVPNTLAANFSQRRSGFIGVATPFEGLLGSDYFAEVCRGFQHVLHAAGWDCALFDTLSPAFNDGTKLALLYRQRKVDGLLIVAPHMDDSFLKKIPELGVPSVAIGEYITAGNVCSVFCDDYDGITQLCTHLHSLGHREIAFIGGPPGLATSGHRFKAYSDFCRRHGLVLPPHFVQAGEYTIASGRAAAAALLQSQVRPTAIMAANDLMAHGALEKTYEMGLRVPDDVSVSGFDDSPMAAQSYPPLTTVHQPTVEMGEVGAGILLRALDNGNLPVGRTQMGVSLVIRNSTAAPGGKRSEKRIVQDDR